MNFRTKKGLEAFQRELNKRRIDIWLVFLSDDHGSEYIDDHFGEIEFLSGFTGSNATMAVTPNSAALWTDGRYFVQAEKELMDSDIKLMKMGEPDVPTLIGFLEKRLKKGMRLGFDGRRVDSAFAKKIEKAARDAGAAVIWDKNYLDKIWVSRPPVSAEPIWIFDEKLSGESSFEKLDRLRRAMKKSGASGHLLTSLTDIAWLLNLRGADIRYTPVFMSWLYLTDERADLYVQKRSLTRAVKRYLRDLGIKIKPYEGIYRDIRKIKEDSVLIDPEVVNSFLVKKLPSRIKVIEKQNPTLVMKARKNRTELKNTRRAHLADGIAVTKFICHIKNAPSDSQLTELLAADILHDFRSVQPGFIDESFETISAYGAHAALPHYSADRESDIRIKKKGLYLFDSGGHYLTGTTDITRTLAMGEVTEEERRGYTMVLKGALALMAARFPRGTKGSRIDALARVPLWNAGFDFNHGTGHGVGHVLSVHEGPNSFSSRGLDCELRPGMITTDEPGLYVPGEYGVRIENELLCVKDMDTDFGRFYRFHNLTLAPIDLDPVDVEMLTDSEKDTLNQYHRVVYDTLKDYLTEEEAAWLKEAAREI